MAACHSMPRRLDHLCKALKTEHQKDESGRGVMLQLSQPRKASKHNPHIRWLPTEVPEKFFSLYTYCMDDVFAERDADDMLPNLTKNERRLYLLDQKINDRGWMVDLDAVADVRFLIAEYKARLAKKCREITGVNPTQTEKLGDWIRAQGVEIPNLQAQTVRDWLKRKDIPQNTRHALRIRSLDAMKAPAKYPAMVRAVCADGALRGMFLYYGASTGRWSSLIVQLQNLFRPIIDDPEIAIEAFRERSIAWLKTIFSENPMKIFASAVRGMLIPRKGRDLVAADFSSIEARIVAWLAFSLELIQIFKTHGLVYEYTASKIFGYPLDLESLKIFKKNHPKLRFLGKIAVLALGYAGGGAAFVKMAKQYGTDVDFEEGERIKFDWRDANPEIADYNNGLWANVQAAAALAIHNPGETFGANRLKFRVVGDYLYMRLPSGRKLAYFKPAIQRDDITYMGIDTYTRQWTRCKTYGGKLVQNAAEGIARDLMVCAMFKLNKKGYPILGTVHDEIITEPKEGFGSVEEVVAVMCDKPAWAKGLPVDADGFRAKRYRK
jgi:DNA polymerase